MRRLNGRTRTKAEYEFVQHVPISQAADVDPAIREAIHRQELDSALLSAHDRAVVAFTAAVVNSPFVADDVFAPVHAELSAREIVEALQVIGFYWAFGRVATVLQVEIEPDHGTAVVQASASEKCAPSAYPDRLASRVHRQVHRPARRLIEGARHPPSRRSSSRKSSSAYSQ
jgi:hypothetical protein